MASPKALNTRRKILQAARDIIREEGLRSLSMDHLAETAQMSKGACMYHFPNKRALHAALVEEYAEHLADELARHEARYEGTPEETLVPGFVDWYRSFDRNNHGWAKVGIELLTAFVNDDEILKPVRLWYKKLFERVNRLPAAQRTQTFVAVMALEGFFYTHKFGVDMMSEDSKRAAWDYIGERLHIAKAARKKTDRV